LHSSSIVPRATRRWHNIFVAAALSVSMALGLLGREQQTGVSLKAVASSFSATVAPTHSPSHDHHHPAPPASGKPEQADAGLDASQRPQPFLETPPPNGPTRF